MAIMESRSDSLPNPKPKPPPNRPPANFNETFLETVTDRNVDFASGEGKIKKL